jgi:hypothetical protein
MTDQRKEQDMDYFRYEIGCAGQFVLNMTSRYANEDEAIAACEHGPSGCEVYDRKTKQWIGPQSWKEIMEAKRRLNNAS